MISALLPSRGRAELLARSAGSLREKALDPDGVEILVAADDDDPETAQAAAALGARVHVMPRAGYARMHEYFGALAALAAGDWLLLWNDDALMMTPGWDAIIGGLPRSVWVADLASAHRPLCAFPAVRREAYEAIGRFSGDNPHVDSFWEWTGRAAGVLAPVPVFVLHDRFDLTGNNGDQTWQERQGGYRSEDFHSPAYQAEIAAYAGIISGAAREAVLCPGFSIASCSAMNPSSTCWSAGWSSRRISPCTGMCSWRHRWITGGTRSRCITRRTGAGSRRGKTG